MPIPSPSNYGITLHASSYRPLLDLLQISQSTFESEIVIKAQRGIEKRLLISHFPHQSSPQHTSLYCHKGKLERLLRRGLDIQRPKILQHIKIPSQDQGIKAIFNDQSYCETRYLFGCDGPHSMIRKALAPEMRLVVLPYVVFNGKRSIPWAEYFENIDPHMGDNTVIYRKFGDARLEISIYDSGVIGVDLRYTYSRPAREGKDPLHRPDRDVAAAVDVPEEFYDELSSLKIIEQPYQAIFNVDKVRDDRVLHWLMRRVMPDIDPVRRLARQGVILLGDAAHAMPILGGEGANLAIKDGIELGEYVASNKLGELSDFASARLGMWKDAVISGQSLLGKMHDKC